MAVGPPREAPGFGLVVAIPAVLAYNGFNRLNRLTLAELAQRCGIDTATMRAAIRANLAQYFREGVDYGVDLPEDDYRCAIRDTYDPIGRTRLTSFSLSAPTSTVDIAVTALARMLGAGKNSATIWSNSSVQSLCALPDNQVPRAMNWPSP